MSDSYKLAIVGVGKIARDQHLGAIRSTHAFELVACVTRSGGVDGVDSYSDIEAMIAATPALQAVTICTPPTARTEIVRVASAAGLHVMIEKPPATTLGAAHAMVNFAKTAGVSIFATWHSREAAGVEHARRWLACRRIRKVRIEWREDIRRWHPGQEWILESGGFGVFDPGINALSIASAILADPLVVESAELDVPEGRGAPIAARLAMRCGDAPVAADFDFLQTGPQSWTIEVETDHGTLKLADGGKTIMIDGEVRTGEDEEYPRLYARFAELIGSGQSDFDVKPLELVADALLIGRTRIVEPFAF